MALMTYIFYNPSTDEEIEVDADDDEMAGDLMFGPSSEYSSRDWILSDVY